jgi:hypothetical protein
MDIPSALENFRANPHRLLPGPYLVDGSGFMIIIQSREEGKRFLSVFLYKSGQDMGRVPEMGALSGGFNLWR